MTVTLYKSATCPQCKVAKMMLEKAGIPFTEEMDMAVMESRGIKSIPTLEVDGERINKITEINKWIKAHAQENPNG
jgi:glutaredoxin